MVVLKAWSEDQDPAAELLKKDIQVIKNTGIGEICLFSLEILLENYGVEGLDDVLSSISESSTEEFPINNLTILMREGIEMIDAVGVPLMNIFREGN